jgi:signal transduction histidine kinase/ligand-binding sensor domain-containing protein/DNA-binding response OmpR family regulator
MTLVEAAKMKKFIVLITFILIICHTSKANDDPSITHLGIGQGLSNNSVRCIFQDHQGFMWFGTYDGLNRYDGQGFKVFRNKLNDTTSLPHNYIYTIHEDQHNRLWIGTGQGLVIYNRLNAVFTPVYYTAYPSKQRNRVSFNVNSVRSDPNGNVFIGTNGWGLLLRKKRDDIAVQVPFKSETGDITGYNVPAFCIDQQQRTWFFIQDIGLCQFDYSTNSIRLVNNTIRTASALEADTKGNIWIGTSNGLYKYSIISNTVTGHFREEKNQLTNNRIASLYMDQKEDLWIGTEGGGINILNITNEKFDYLLPGEDQKNLSSESVYALKRDKENRMWIGTLKGGIDIIDIQKSRFKTVTHDRLDKNSLVNNFVSTFYEDNSNNLWIGTDGGGMSIWDRTQNKFTNFRHETANPASLSNNSVTCIMQDHRRYTWIATFGGGINKFDPATRKFEHFKCINSSTGEENKNVWLLYEDRDKNLWATTFGNGKLYRFNDKLNTFEVFDQQLNDLISITEDHKGDLWAGNAYQLIRIDKNGKEHVRYNIGKPTRAIYEDKQKRLWVGTEGGGLILFDRAKGTIANRYSDADGLCNNAVLNILEDEEGKLWISTFNGLSAFDPSTGKFKNFYQSDGLQSNQFSFSAALQLQSGELAFGGIGGFNIFYPADIHPREYMPVVYFTDIRVNNKPLADVDDYITKSNNDRIDELKIPYKEAVLFFTFTALEYTSSEKIRYAYYLEGWDKNWNYTGNVRTINYNNISEGSYILRVKSTNAEGAWNTNETRLRLVILPPWYRTWWAYLIYASIAIALLYVFFRYKSGQTKLKYEIKLAHINAEKEKEINEKRQSFFTNVSHEFRTPLTLVINPIKDILKKDDPALKSEQGELNIVYRNARRLLSLVDQLLLFRKAENIADQLRITKLNFYTVCKEIFLCFVQQAKAKKIEYIYECENEQLEIYADREKMEIIFYNLLSNALKYTPEEGKVIFSIKETASTVEVTIADTGYGIPKEAGNKLFEKFYQVKDKGSPAKPGFGIGLYLVKQSVDSHKGQISFITEPGKGTSFNVSLKKGKAHFGEQFVNEESSENSVLLEELAGDDLETYHPLVGKHNGEGLEAVITEKASILIIDDNESMRKYVTGMFEGNFVVHEADKAEEGLKLAKQYQPDIIISDIVMQGMTGIELCRTIKETPALSHIPVILLTGSFSPESKLKGVEGGADDYITKPFEKDLLLARVSSLLKSRQNLQKYFYNEITHQENSLKISAEYKEFLEKCIAIVENHLDDDAFTIQTLATEIGMSHSKLYKKIKAISGQSANAFIRFIRLRKAAELFINTNYNVNETAFYVGLRDIKYFREQFYKAFGMNPSEYIEKYRKVFSRNYNLNEKAVREKDPL